MKLDYEKALCIMAEIHDRNSIGHTDNEIDHYEADDLLCELIESLTGDDKLTNMFRDLDIWYS